MYLGIYIYIYIYIMTVPANELDSFDGRRDPERCNTLVNKLRVAQDRVLHIIDDGSSISTRIRSCLPRFSLGLNLDILRYSFYVVKIIDYRYISAMVPVKSVKEHDAVLDVAVLFSDVLDRALRLRLVTQDQIDFYDPSVMITIPRLSIVWSVSTVAKILRNLKFMYVTGLLYFPEGALNVDGPQENFSEMFRPFYSLLIKIRDLLRILTPQELTKSGRSSKGWRIEGTTYIENEPIKDKENENEKDKEFDENTSEEIDYKNRKMSDCVHILCIYSLLGHSLNRMIYDPVSVHRMISSIGHFHINFFIHAYYFIPIALFIIIVTLLFSEVRKILKLIFKPPEVIPVYEVSLYKVVFDLEKWKYKRRYLSLLLLVFDGYLMKIVNNARPAHHHSQLFEGGIIAEIVDAFSVINAVLIDMKESLLLWLFLSPVLPSMINQMIYYSFIPKLSSNIVIFEPSPYCVSVYTQIRHSSNKTTMFTAFMLVFFRSYIFLCLWAHIPHGTPHGQLPVLEIDGKVLAQSRTIERFLGRCFGLAGKDDWEQARMDELVSCVDDLLIKMSPWFKEQDNAKKIEIFKALCDNEVIPFLTRFEDIIENSGTGFFVGKELSYADLSIFHIFWFLNTKILPGA
uniref:RING-type domain-containing protein n=1 Tax=Heterorhabditis bacteriophora TaxID=37862 RepID=A0A1I7WNT8_HETBA